MQYDLEAMLKKVYLIPNAITAFGLSCGLFVIFKTCVADPDKNLFFMIQSSAILLLIAAFADLADGAVARLVKGESEFGGHFDSLSDSVTFGVAPPLLVLRSLGDADIGRLLGLLVIVASMIYALCGVLRLVRFNVSQKQGHGADLEASSKRSFTGLPIPAAASAAVSAALILVSPLVEEHLALSSQVRALILIGVLIILGYFMVSRWRFPSLKTFHFRVPSFYLVFATGVIAVFLLYGILDYFAVVFFVASWIYLCVAWALSIIRLIAGKRSKTLVDFEPDDDDEGL